MDDLALRIHSLPAELFNHIQDLVFTLDNDKPFAILDKHYRPPPQLQINRATRASFASLYYSTTLFAVAEPFTVPKPFNRFLLPFLSSIPSTHSRSIGRLHIWQPRSQRICDSEMAECAMRCVWFHLRGKGAPLGPDTELSFDALLTETESGEVRGRTLRCKFALNARLRWD